MDLPNICINATNRESDYYRDVGRLGEKKYYFEKGGVVFF